MKDSDFNEPTVADLEAIEAEMPLIAAGVDLVDAEIGVLINPADAIARRAHRRAVSAVLSLLVQQANHDAAIGAGSAYTVTNSGPAASAVAA